jgi:hypothetical protein
VCVHDTFLVVPVHLSPSISLAMGIGSRIAIQFYQGAEYKLSELLLILLRGLLFFLLVLELKM